jgi:hypothetical protein
MAELTEKLAIHICGMLDLAEVIAMSQVNMKWRRLLLCTPHVWAEIRIPVMVAPRLDDKYLSVLLRRSGNKCVDQFSSAPPLSHILSL